MGIADRPAGLGIAAAELLGEHSIKGGTRDDLAGIKPRYQ